MNFWSNPMLLVGHCLGIITFNFHSRYWGSHFTDEKTEEQEV